MKSSLGHHKHRAFYLGQVTWLVLRAVNANLAIAALWSLTLTLISGSDSALTSPISASVSAPR